MPFPLILAFVFGLLFSGVSYKVVKSKTRWMALIIIAILILGVAALGLVVWTSFLTTPILRIRNLNIILPILSAAIGVVVPILIYIIRGDELKI